MEPEGTLKLPSVVLVAIQLLAAASMATVPFFVLSPEARNGMTTITLRIAVSILLMLNCCVARFMKTRVIVLAGIGMNLLVVSLLSALIKFAGPDTGEPNPYLPRLVERRLAIVMIGITGATVVLQAIFLGIFRHGTNVFGLCSGDLDTVYIDDHDYVDINGELLRLQDVKPQVLRHTKCGPGMVPAWLMRMLAIGFLPLSILFFILSITILVNTSETSNQDYAMVSRAIARLYLEHAIVLLVWAIFTLFASFRFSSRRRLLYFWCIGVGIVIYTMATFFVALRIRARYQNQGEFLPGFLVLSASATASWCIMTIWALRHRRNFDYSCCVCFQLRFEGLGHCTIA